MNNNIFKLYIRNSILFKTNFLINLLGLSIGIATFILISLWIQQQFSVDKGFKDSDRVFQILRHTKDGSRKIILDNGPVILAKNLKKDFSEVEYSSVLFPTISVKMSVKSEKEFIKADSRFVSEDFFKIINQKLLYGKPDEVLSQSDAVVISRSLAIKLFGSEHKAIGKPLIWNAGKVEYYQKVSGVFKDFGKETTFSNDLFLPETKVNALLEAFGHSDVENSWNSNNSISLIKLKKGVDLNSFERNIEFYKETKTEDGATDTFFIQKFEERYLNNFYINDKGEFIEGRIERVRLLIIVAFLILLLASINYINLATVNAARRAKEIGILRAIGTTSKGISFQYFFESIMTSLLGFIIGVILVYLLLPEFNTLMQTELFLEWNIMNALFAVVLVLILGFISGIYPALYCNKLTITDALKGEIAYSKKENLVRKGLVVFQFTMALIFISFLLIINKQIEYINTKDLNIAKNQVVYLNMEGNLPSNKKTINELVRNSNFLEAVSFADEELVGNYSNSCCFTWEGITEDEKEISINRQWASENYIDAYGLELVKGRDFSYNYSNESENIIINETAASLFGFENPIGKVINYSSGEKFTIIGVVKDFYFTSLDRKIPPFIIFYDPDISTSMIVRLKEGYFEEGLKDLERIYKEINPDYSFNPSFVSQDFASMHQETSRLGKIANYFTGFAILISCMGLFGLSLYSAEKRRKEIGIRRALGQSRFAITKLLTIDFLKLVFYSVLIGMPLAFFYSYSWLEGFRYKIELNPLYFVLAALSAILIAFLTVIIQTNIAANRNPSEVLKEE